MAVDGDPDAQGWMLGPGAAHAPETRDCSKRWRTCIRIIFGSRWLRRRCNVCSSISRSAMLMQEDLL